MRVCRRDAFVGNTLQRQALVDAPIRINAAGFNISAPHMHACCLEAMQLGPGHRYAEYFVPLLSLRPYENMNQVKIGPSIPQLPVLCCDFTL